MNKFSLIFLSLILNQLLVYSISKSCGEEEITNCKECGVAENSNSCGICEDNHFPLLDNLLCFPCDDPIYGQAGCKGQCDSSKYSSSGFVYCKNCKDGYYNLEDLCHSCDSGSPGCSNCTNEKDPDTGIEKFKCLKCLNEQEYRIWIIVKNAIMLEKLGFKLNVINVRVGILSILKRNAKDVVLIASQEDGVINVHLIHYQNIVIVILNMYYLIILVLIVPPIVIHVNIIVKLNQLDA